MNLKKALALAKKNMQAENRLNQMMYQTNAVSPRSQRVGVTPDGAREVWLNCDQAGNITVEEIDWAARAIENDEILRKL